MDGIGNILQPMDCFINMRGLKTLAVRIDEELGNKKPIIDVLTEMNIPFSHNEQLTSILINVPRKCIEALDLSKKKWRNSNFTHLEIGEEYSLMHVGIEADMDDIVRDLRKLCLDHKH